MFVQAPKASTDAAEFCLSGLKMWDGYAADGPVS
jgi:hypothetical protein